MWLSLALRHNGIADVIRNGEQRQTRIHQKVCTRGAEERHSPHIESLLHMLLVVPTLASGTCVMAPEACRAHRLHGNVLCSLGLVEPRGS